MGVSTDAILFYGYCWHEEGASIYGERGESDADDDDDGDRYWPERVLANRGVKNPYDDFPKEIEAIRNYDEKRRKGDEWFAANRPSLDAWYKAKRDVEIEFGCSIGQHCSGDYPMPYVFVNASITRAARGYPKEITSLSVGDDWNEKLAKFVAELGIVPPEGQEPKWWLVSYWG